MIKSRFRSTYILLGIFLVLLLVVVFFENEGADKKKLESNESNPIFTTSQIASVDKVVFSSMNPDESGEMIIGEITLKKEEDHWTVNDKLADADESSKISEYLATVSSGKVVSKNSANWDKYVLTEEKARKATIYSSDKLLSTLYFGSFGVGSQAVHMRVDDDERVRLVDTSFAQLFTYEVARWTNKSLFVLEKDDISSMTVRVGEDRWIFTADGDTWSQVSDLGTFAISQTEDFQTYLDNILELKGIGVESDLSLFGDADNAVAFSLRNGDEYVVSIDTVDEENKRVFAMTSAQLDLILISSDYTDRLKPDFLKIDSADDSDNPDEVLSGKSIDIDSEYVE